MVRPDTRTGCSDINKNLESMKLSQFKHGISRWNINICRVDEWDLHCRRIIIGYCESTTKPLLHLVTPTIQGLHGYQEEWVEGRLVTLSIACKKHEPEEIKTTSSIQGGGPPNTPGIHRSYIYLDWPRSSWTQRINQRNLTWGQQRENHPISRIPQPI